MSTALKLRDIIEMGPLLGGLTPQNIVGEVVSISPGRVEVALTFFGVRIGRAERTDNGEELKWTMLA